jgi:hypothetical protein
MKKTVKIEQWHNRASTLTSPFSVGDEAYLIRTTKNDRGKKSQSLNLLAEPPQYIGGHGLCEEGYLGSTSGSGCVASYDALGRFTVESVESETDDYGYGFKTTYTIKVAS